VVVSDDDKSAGVPEPITRYIVSAAARLIAFYREIMCAIIKSGATRRSAGILAVIS
jgi:hypothetical protein